MRLSDPTPGKRPRFDRQYQYPNQVFIRSLLETSKLGYVSIASCTVIDNILLRFSQTCEF